MYLTRETFLRSKRNILCLTFNHAKESVSSKKKCSYIIKVSEKISPGKKKIPPRKLRLPENSTRENCSPENCPPGKLPSGKLPHGKMPLGKLSPVKFTHPLKKKKKKKEQKRILIP